MPKACLPIFLLLLIACTSTNHRPPLPMDVHAGHAYVRVAVNNSEPLWFLIDSGAAAPVNLIDSTRAAALNLVLGDEKTAGAIGGSTKVRLTERAQLTMGGIDLGNDPLATIDLSGAGDDAGRRVDGMLGYAFFARHVLTLDYPRRRLLIGVPPSAGIAVPLTMHGKAPVIEATISIGGLSDQRVRLLVDTGFDDTFLLTSPFVQKHQLRGSSTEERGAGASLGGSTNSLLAKARKIAIGSIELHEPTVRLSLDERGAFASDQVDGFVGGKFLEQYAVTFDYARGVMTLR